MARNRVTTVFPAPKQLPWSPPFAPPSAANVLIISAGWSVALSKSGRRYYVNEIDKTTRWEKPRGPATSGGCCTRLSSVPPRSNDVPSFLPSTMFSLYCRPSACIVACRFILGLWVTCCCSGVTLLTVPVVFQRFQFLQTYQLFSRPFFPNYSTCKYASKTKE